MPSVVLPVLLVIATVMGAGMVLPQVLRLHRLGTVEGLSGAWVGVGIVMNTWWVAYAISGDLWGVIPVSAAGAALYSVIAFQYMTLVGAKAGGSLTFGALGLGMIPLPFLVVGGWEAAGVAIGLSYGLQFAPAATSALRSVRLDALSPATWTMAWIEAVVWFTYGWSVGDRALLLGGGSGAVMSTVVLVQLSRTQRVYPDMAEFSVRQA